MKILVFVLASLSVALAATLPQKDDETHAENHVDHDNSWSKSARNAVQIVRYFYDHRGLDGYKFT